MSRTVGQGENAGGMIGGWSEVGTMNDGSHESVGYRGLQNNMAMPPTSPADATSGRLYSEVVTNSPVPSSVDPARTPLRIHPHTSAPPAPPTESTEASNNDTCLKTV